VSVRTPAACFKRMANEAYYTPAHAVHSLLDFAEEVGLYAKRGETWECAGGAGHIARVLKGAGHRVIATDIEPATAAVFPVSQLNFLESRGLSSTVIHLITNPPYGHMSRLALQFLTHGLNLLKRGAITTLALLLPFEFDGPTSRLNLVGEHPLFLRKVTVGRRIRWINLPQSKHPPMGMHAWFIWTADAFLLRRARGPGITR
jgi:hypothetical protein